jgi:multiple sugar transport system substrate-binding protein
MTSRIAGTSPDIYNVYSVWSGQMTEAGLLAEPPRAVLDFIRASYVPSTVDGVQARGKVWGIPAEISTYLLVYNKQLLHEAGFDAPPRNWDELCAIAAKVTKRNAQGNVTTAVYAFGPTAANAAHPFLALLAARGVVPLKPEASALNTPDALAVMTGMAQLYADGSAANRVQVRDFPSGTVGMAIIANWFKDTLRQGFGERFADTVGVAPIRPTRQTGRPFNMPSSGASMPAAATRTPPGRCCNG